MKKRNSSFDDEIRTLYLSGYGVSIISKNIHKSTYFIRTNLQAQNIPTRSLQEYWKHKLGSKKNQEAPICARVSI